VQTEMHTFTQVRACTRTHTCTHTHMHANTHAYIHTHVCHSHADMTEPQQALFTTEKVAGKGHAKMLCQVLGRSAVRALLGNLQMLLKHPHYTDIQVSGKSSNSLSASLRAQRLLKLLESHSVGQPG